MNIQSSVADRAVNDAVLRSGPIAANQSLGACALYQIVLCTDATQFEALSVEWSDLLKRAFHSNAFLAHQWISTWWRLLRSLSGKRQLFILTARDPAGKLCGVLPLELETVGIGPFSYRILRIAGTANEAPEHLDIIVDANDRRHITSALLDALNARRSEFDIIQFTDLAEEALLLPALAKWSEATGIAYQRRTWNICPYVTTVGTFEAYFKTVSQKHRYKVRLFGRRLAEHHAVTFHVARTPNEVAVAIDELFALHAKRWTIKNDDVSGFDNETSRRFHRGVAAALAAQDGVRIFVLRCDDRPVAACYCFLFDGRLFFYQPGWDPAFRQFHVAKILLGHAIQYCFGQGIREFDFLRGTEDYKFDWTDQTRQTVAWDAGVSARGCAVLAFGRAVQRINGRLLRLRKRVVEPLKQSKRGTQAVEFIRHLVYGGKPSKPTGAAIDSSESDGAVTEAKDKQ